MRTRRDLKTRPFTTAGSIIAAIICALLTIRSGQVEIVNHAVLDELRAIELNSASLQRDVLRVRAGQKMVILPFQILWHLSDKMQLF